MIRGKPFETLEYHRRQLVRELGEKMGVPSEEGNDRFRNRLLGLLSSVSKQNSTPADNSDWVKLLNKWIKANSSGAVLSNREIYEILAVDGFRGFKPKHLKLHLPEVLSPPRKERESHRRGVRSMYDFFRERKGVSGLTGTDSACVVFLALIRWYSSRMRDDLMLDDQIEYGVGRAKIWAEGFLQQHADYYPDVKNVDEELLEEFGGVYERQFRDESWREVGRELLAGLNRQ